MHDDLDDLRLDALLEDILAVETIDPDLVLRYDADPRELSDAERAEVQAWLACPANRDALAAMKRLHATALKPAGPAVDRTRASLARAPRRWRALPWTIGVAAVGISAAALFVAFLIEEPQPNGLQVTQVERVPAPAAEPSVPSPAPAPVILAPSTPAEVDRAPRAADPPISAVPSSPSAPAAPLLEPDADASPVVPAAPTPKPQPRPAPDAPQVEPPVESEPATPIQLALLELEYRAPGSSDFTRLEGQLRSSAVRSGVFAISPEDHVGWTASAQPELYWFLETLPPAGAIVRLTLADEAQGSDLVDMELPSPTASGLQRVQLTSALEADTEYRWSISIATDPDRPALDEVSSGGVRFTPAPVDVLTKLSESDPGAHPAIWASAGYFFDAFAALQTVASSVDPESFREAQSALLRRAGIEASRIGLP